MIIPPNKLTIKDFCPLSTALIINLTPIKTLSVHKIQLKTTLWISMSIDKTKIFNKKNIKNKTEPERKTPIKNLL